MAEAVATSSLTAAAAPKGLVARIFGVLLAPRATYADVAAHPRWLGVLAVILLVMATGSIILFSTDVGKEALLDQQVTTMESLGLKVSDEMYQRMEESTVAAGDSLRHRRHPGRLRADLHADHRRHRDGGVQRGAGR